MDIAREKDKNLEQTREAHGELVIFFFFIQYQNINFLGD